MRAAALTSVKLADRDLNCFPLHFLQCKLERREVHENTCMVKVKTRPLVKSVY